MLKKFLVAMGILFLLVMAACSDDSVAGGTTDPNAIAQKMSSSAMKSSAAAFITSSSSQGKSTEDYLSSSSSERNRQNDTIYDLDTLPYVPHTDTHYVAVVWSFSAQCIVDYVEADLDEPSVVADAGAPEAYKTVVDDSIKVSLQAVYLNLPCGGSEVQEKFIEEINSRIRVNVGLVGDTLKMSLLEYQGCACAAEVDFTLGKGIDFNYVAFDRREPLPVQDK